MQDSHSFRLLASDFGGLVEDFLLFVGFITAISLALAVITSAVLVRVTRRKRWWLLVPLSTVLYFAAALGIHELYLTMTAPPVREFVPPRPVGGPESEHSTPAPEVSSSPPIKETE